MRSVSSLVLLVLVGCGEDAGPDAAADCPATDLDVFTTGDPDWCLVDGVLFSSRAEAPIENALRETADAALPRHTWDSFNNYYRSEPVEPHAPPYDDEVHDGVLGFGRVPATTFTTEEATAPFAIYGMAMVVPGADALVGNTYDGDPLPLIGQPGNFTVTTALLLVNDDGTTDQVDGGSTTLSGVGPPHQGVSHAPIMWVEQSDTPSPGSYELWLEVDDNRGGGRLMTIPFTVE
jgi:hypothetical protein